MTLREFVSDTLSQIVRGVADAKGMSHYVAPQVAERPEGGSYVTYRDHDSGPAVFVVEFDVAVTVSKKTDINAKGGITVHVFEAGAKRTASAEHSTVSRIKFGVPVVYSNP